MKETTFKKFIIALTEKLSSNMIKKLLESHKAFKKYAYVYRYKEIYTADDERKNKQHINGMPKPHYWYILIDLGKERATVDIIAECLGIDKSCVQGEKRSMNICIKDMLNMLPDSIGGMYPVSDIESNFKINVFEKIKVNGEFLDKKHIYGQKIIRGEMTLNQLSQENDWIYYKNQDWYNKLRNDYIFHCMKVPRVRVNIYMYCEDKSSLDMQIFSETIAQYLYPRFDYKDASFSSKNDFSKYDGQPVVIWNEENESILDKLRGLIGFFNVFDLFPVNVPCHVGRNYVNLCNDINIVNNCQSHEEFFNKIAKCEDDIDFIHRCFPIIVRMKKYKYDILINKGVLFGTSEFTSYIKMTDAETRDIFSITDDYRGYDMDLLLFKTVLPVIDAYREIVRQVINRGKERAKQILSIT